MQMFATRIGSTAPERHRCAVSDRQSPGDPSVERLVGFTNGVVAIAITVIALPLVDTARSVGSRLAIDFLSANVLNLSAAALSFVVIAASPGHDPVAAGVYVATVFVAEVSIRIQKVILTRRGLLGPGTEASTRFVWADWILVLLALVALIVTVLVPATSLYPLVLILLARPIKWLALRGAP
jgi:uncharacterized membrane protein